MIKAIIMCVLLSTGLMAGVTDDTEYKLVSNAEEPKTLSINELSLIYYGKIKSWSDGRKIKIYVRPFNDYVQKKLVMEVLGVSLGTFKERVANNKDVTIIPMSRMISTLAMTSGSIGVISDTQVVIATDSGLQLVNLMEY